MDNFNGPADQTERERLGRRIEGGPGPLGYPEWSQEDGKRFAELHDLEVRMKGVQTGIVEVEQHIIDRLKAESGASNIKLLAEALEIVTGMRRRGG